MFGFFEVINVIEHTYTVEIQKREYRAPSRLLFCERVTGSKGVICNVRVIDKKRFIRANNAGTVEQNTRAGPSRANVPFVLRSCRHRVKRKRFVPAASIRISLIVFNIHCMTYSYIVYNTMRSFPREFL